MASAARQLTTVSLRSVDQFIRSVGLGTHQICSRSYSAKVAASEDEVYSIKAGPSVKLLLTLYMVKPSAVPATGPHGRLLKGDVLNYIIQHELKPLPFGEKSTVEVEKVTVKQQLSTAAAKPTPTAKPTPAAARPASEKKGSYIDHELSSMRKTIAKRLTQSKTTIPHMYAVCDIKTDKLTAFRKYLIDTAGVKCSVNDILIKSVALTLQAHPDVNSIWSEEGPVLQTSSDISVAVATDSGLITPIIKSAHQKSLSNISAEIRELAGRARENKLRPEEFMGGTFTISNLGMMGITEFSAVINPPQSSILAVGCEQLSVSADLTPQRFMSVCLSADRRCVDETHLNNFLQDLKAILEEPNKLML